MPGRLRLDKGNITLFAFILTGLLFAFTRITKNVEVESYVLLAVFSALFVFVISASNRIETILFYIMYYMMINASITFSSMYLTNPFDTTGIRGFIQNIISAGHIPSEGPYVNFFGRYDRLPLGPLYITILKLVALDNGTDMILLLDIAVKVMELNLKVLCILLIYLIVRNLSPNSDLRTHIYVGVSASTITILIVPQSVYTAQFYAIPQLLLILYLLYTYMIKSESNLSILILYIALLISFVNSHSVTPLIFTIFLVLVVIYNHRRLFYNSGPSFIFIAFILTTSLFTAKLIYDAVFYFRSFVIIGKELLRDIISLFLEGITVERLVEHPQVEKALRPELSYIEIFKLGIARLYGDVIKIGLLLSSSIYFVYLYIKVMSRGKHSLKNDALAFPIVILDFVLSFLAFILLINGASLYTALGFSMQSVVYSIPLLHLFLARLVKSKAIVKHIFLVIITTSLIVNGNPIIIPNIEGEPVMPMPTNTIYKVEAIEFLSSYSDNSSIISIDSDFVSAWQIAGYAPSISKYLTFKSPVIYSEIRGKLALLPSPISRGQLGEPLEYRLHYHEVINIFIKRYSLIYNNLHVVLFLNE